MLDLQNAIIEKINTSPDNSVSVKELFSHNLGVWENIFQQYLLELWREGKVFVSNVEYSLNGYLPNENAKWATVKILGYYGYDAQWGIYEVSEKPLEPLKIRLESTINAGFQIHCIAISNDGKDFLIGGKSDKILLGDLKRIELKKQYISNSNVWSLAFSPLDNQFFISGHNDGSIWIWNKNTDEKKSVSEVGDRVTALQYSPDGNNLISSHQLIDKKNFPIHLWRINNLESPSSIGHHSENVYCVSYLPDGESIVSAGSGRVLKHYSLIEQIELFESKIQTGTISCLAVHPYVPLVVTGSWSGKYNVYDLNKKEQLIVVEAHNSRITTVAISPAGHLLATGSRDSQIAIWKLPEFTLLKRFVAHNGWVRSLVFSNNETLLSGGTDELCKIWYLNYIGQIPLSREEFIRNYQNRIEDIDD